MFVYNGEQYKSHSFLLNSVFVFFFKLSPWIFNHWVPVISFNSRWILVSSLEASSTPVGPSRLTRIFRLWKALSGSTCLERSWLKTWSRSWWTRIIHKLRPLWWGWKSLSLRWINHLTRRKRSRILEARSKVRMRCSRSPLKRREVRTTRTTIHFELKSITCHNDFCHF